MEGHRLANYFPAIEGEEFDELMADIKKNGQLNPIILFEGKILDGKNRFKACTKLGIEPITKEYDGNDPLSFVISNNVMRRHLTESQRAMLATEMLPEFEAKAKERKIESNKTRNKKPTVSIDTVDKSEYKRSTKEAGDLFGIGQGIVSKAKKIKKAADEGEIEKETIADIIKGKKTVNAVDKELHDKRYVKKAKEDEKKENKKLPNQHPKAVKDYIDFLHEAKNKIDLATKLKQEGMFPPESMQFIKRLHSQIIEMFKYMEEEDEEN